MIDTVCETCGTPTRRAHRLVADGPHGKRYAYDCTQCERFRDGWSSLPDPTPEKRAAWRERRIARGLPVPPAPA